MSFAAEESKGKNTPDTVETILARLFARRNMDNVDVVKMLRNRIGTVNERKKGEPTADIERLAGLLERLRDPTQAIALEEGDREFLGNAIGQVLLPIRVEVSAISDQESGLAKSHDPLKDPTALIAELFAAEKRGIFDDLASGEKPQAFDIEQAKMQGARRSRSMYSQHSLMFEQETTFVGDVSRDLLALCKTLPKPIPIPTETVRAFEEDGVSTSPP